MNDTKVANEIYHNILLTLYSFYREVQYILFYTLSLSAIRNALGVPCTQYINDWLIKSFFPHKIRFARNLLKWRMHMGVNNTSHLEVTFSTKKNKTWFNHHVV